MHPPRHQPTSCFLPCGPVTAPRCKRPVLTWRHSWSRHSMCHPRSNCHPQVLGCTQYCCQCQLHLPLRILQKFWVSVPFLGNSEKYLHRSSDNSRLRSKNSSSGSICWGGMWRGDNLMETQKQNSSCSYQKSLLFDQRMKLAPFSGAAGASRNGGLRRGTSRCRIRCWAGALASALGSSSSSWSRCQSFLVNTARFSTTWESAQKSNDFDMWWTMKLLEHWYVVIEFRETDTKTHVTYYWLGS